VEKAPLAWRIRPRNLDQLLGQEHLLSKGKPLREMIECNMITSVILYGPPGVGKSCLALTSLNSKGEATKKLVEEIAQKVIPFDNQLHYDAISAFIKSMRGSDPDATLFWLAFLLESVYLGIKRAKEEIKKRVSIEVPSHLRNAYSYLKRSTNKTKNFKTLEK